jgi:hypothetical protein
VINMVASSIGTTYSCDASSSMRTL